MNSSQVTWLFCRQCRKGEAIEKMVTNEDGYYFCRKCAKRK